MAYGGNALAGDTMYGNFMPEIGHQLLHCRKCSFTHPVTGEDFCLEADLPQDFADAINSMKEIE